MLTIRQKQIFEYVKKYIERKDYGIPIGHVLSTFLENVFLNPIDHQLKDKIVIRFSDNWFFAMENTTNYQEDIKLLERLLRARNLTLNQEKTKLIFKPKPETLLIL